MVPGLWDFPQLRAAGELIAPTAQISCLFGLEMTSVSDVVVQQAINLIKSSPSDSLVAHRVIVTTFLNHAAIQAIIKAYEA